MLIDPATAIDRALYMLPACEQRDRLVEALIDDAESEDGSWPRHQRILTAGDFLALAADELVKAGVTSIDHEWMLRQLGVEPKRKPGWPKGKPRKNVGPQQSEA